MPPAGKAGIALALLAVVWAPARAAQLPVRTYTTADGLPRNNVSWVYSDSRGFLWLCTIEGLARFDGYEFRTYGVADGLPHPVVNTIIETRAGLLVIGTHEGLAVLRTQMEERTHRRFDVFYPGPTGGERQINALFEDRDGVLWCATAQHLYRIRWRGSVPSFETAIRDVAVQDFAQDRAGNLWMAAWDQGVVELTPSGAIHRYGKQRGGPYLLSRGRDFGLAYVVAVDTEDTVWVGTHNGLCRLRSGPGADGSIVERLFDERDGLRYSRVNSLYVTRTGRLWIGLAEGGTAEWTGDAKRPFRMLRAAEGLVDRGSNAMGEDGSGNLWIATGDEGAKRIARDGFVTYTTADGLARNIGTAFAEGRNGDLFAVNLMPDSLDLNRFDGERFHAIHPKLPAHTHWLGWGTGRMALQDCEGDWWIATGEGLCRFDGRAGAAGLATRLPKARYTPRDGLPAAEIFRLFEDSRGDIWVATNAPSSVTRWDRASGSFQKPAGIPENDRVYAGFAEDRGGNVWIASSTGFFRWREGRLERVDQPGTEPATAAALYLDHSGRMWLGNRQGLFRSDQPAAQRPEFTKVLGEAVQCVTEDRYGRIYACTGHGVACLDPANGRLRRFTTADGLGPGNLQSAFTDRRGDVWFGLTRGVSRFTPQADTPHPAAPVYITSIRASGRDVPAAERGEKAAAGISLQPYENSIEVNFVGIELGAGRSLRYEYKLQGAQNDWQALGRERSIRFASLSPGNYRLLVRAINNEGTATDPPASVELFVATPMWRRWWSLALIAMGVAYALYGVHRSRMRTALELERIRTRIATDLHDDVGASLSQVAIMSEVASRRAAADREALNEIAGASREVLQSMSEIVWAIDPRHDRLQDLTQRMRWFAGETLSAAGVALHFSVVGNEREPRLRPDTRRQLFLIFKECVNNIVRHAGAGNVNVALTVELNRLVMRIEDDGCGFDTREAGAGHGLRNMASRAEQLGAAFELRSRPGEGTCLCLRVPIGRGIGAAVSA